MVFQQSHAGHGGALPWVCRPGTERRGSGIQGRMNQKALAWLASRPVEITRILGLMAIEESTSVCDSCRGAVAGGMMDSKGEKA